MIEVEILIPDHTPEGHSIDRRIQAECLKILTSSFGGWTEGTWARGGYRMADGQMVVEHCTAYRVAVPWEDLAAGKVAAVCGELRALLRQESMGVRIPAMGVFVCLS